MFRIMADSIQRKGKEITLITMGDATDVLYLKTRTEARDVCVLWKSITVPGGTQMVQEASQLIPLAYGQKYAKWMHNTCEAIVLDANMNKLTQEAIQQNVVVYRHQGLRILAAPWKYTLAWKLELAVHTNKQEMVELLHLIIQKMNGQVLSMNRFKDMMFNANRISLKDVIHVNNLYKRKYKTFAIQVMDEELKLAKSNPRAMLSMIAPAGLSPVSSTDMKSPELIPGPQLEF